MLMGERKNKGQSARGICHTGKRNLEILAKSKKNYHWKWLKSRRISKVGWQELPVDGTSLLRRRILLESSILALEFMSVGLDGLAACVPVIFAVSSQRVFGFMHPGGRIRLA